MKHLACPKCNGEMKAGVIASIAHNGIQRMRLLWLEEAESGFFGGETVRSAEDEEVELTDFACTKCGFVESYVGDRIRKYLEDNEGE